MWSNYKLRKYIRYILESLCVIKYTRAFRKSEKFYIIINLYKRLYYFKNIAHVKLPAYR